ncbi:MAG: hypothetical protein GY757_49990, partial [bacterium]|nr:hypothetical protein [bacterium]
NYVMKLETGNRKNLRLLTTLLSSPGNQSIVVAACDEPGLLKKITGLLAEELKKNNTCIYTLDIASPPGEPVNLVKTIQRVIPTGNFLSIKQAHRHVVLSVTGAEKLAGKQVKEFVKYLNFMRDDFAKINYPVIIWVTTTLADRIALDAPDFWSWRSAFFEFLKPEGEMRQSSTVSTNRNGNQATITIGQHSSGNVVAGRDIINIKRGIIDIKEIKGNVAAANTISSAKPVNTLSNALRSINAPSLNGWYKSYVPRPGNFAGRLKAELNATSGNDKFPVAGQRGTGLSTELKKIEDDLKADYFINFHSTSPMMELYTFEPVWLLFSMLFSLYREAAEKDVLLDPSLIEGIARWFMGMNAAARSELNLDISTPRNLLALYPDFHSKMVGNESFSRKAISYLRSNMTTLFDTFNHLIRQVEKSTSKRVLMIVDDLDKLPMEYLENLLEKHSQLLLQPQCKIIYSLSLGCNLLPGLKEHIIDKFGHGLHILANIEVRDKKNVKCKEGIAFLEDVMHRYLPGDIITPGVPEKAAYISGGNLSTCLALILEAGLVAMANEREKIILEDINKSTAALRNALSRTLTKEDYQFLERVHHGTVSGSQQDVDAFLKHITYQTITVYGNGNGSVWYDIHPLVKN